MKNSNQNRFAAGVTQKTGLLAAALITALVFATSAPAQQQAAAEDQPGYRAMVTIAKTMDPNSWAQMMTMAMDPRIWMNPISSCAACHDNEDVGRYQQVFGPMTSMMNPAMWANPEAYNELMASMFDARAAEEWSKAVMDKYGLQPGDPMPTMHSGWPWPYPSQSMTPMPAPAQ